VLDTEDNLESGESEFREMSGESHSLIRTVKSIVVRDQQSNMLDPRIISPKFYNCFNYSMLSRTQTSSQYTIGVTSAQPGDGKTIVAANIAVSVAVADERETLLLDLNLRSPMLHTVFGIGLSPGFADALTDSSVYVARTPVRNLHVMTAGNPGLLGVGFEYQRGWQAKRNGMYPWKDAKKNNGKSNGRSNGKSNGAARSANLMFVANFRDVLFSLQQRFEIIIVELPPLMIPVLRCTSCK
jgi:Mrp family chromosome partitioning ATPase